MTADTYSPNKEQPKEVKMANNNTNGTGNTPTDNGNVVIDLEERHFLFTCLKLKHADKIANCLGEIFSTATLLFLTCMACVEGLGEPLNVLQVNLACGLAVLVVLCIFGGITHCHLNPSITLAAIVCRIISIPMAIILVICQLAGALVGVALVRAVSPSQTYLQTNATSGLCMTLPNEQLTTVQAVSVEALLTVILIWITCALWDPRNSKWQGSASIKFGFAITTLIIAGGPFTGASMNPVRSLAPAIFAGDMTAQWVYTVGPLLGSAFASVTYRIIFFRKMPDCC